MSGIRYAFKKQKSTHFFNSHLGKVSRKRAWKILLPQQTRGWLIGAKRITHPYANVNQYEAPPLATTARSYWFIDLHDPRTSAYEIEVKSNSKSRIYLTTTACKMAIIRELTLAHGALNDKIGSRSLHNILYPLKYGRHESQHFENEFVYKRGIDNVYRETERKERRKSNSHVYKLLCIFIFCSNSSFLSLFLFTSYSAFVTDRS